MSETETRYEKLKEISEMLKELGRSGRVSDDGKFIDGKPFSGFHIGCLPVHPSEKIE